MRSCDFLLAGPSGLTVRTTSLELFRDFNAFEDDVLRTYDLFNLSFLFSLLTSYVPESKTNSPSAKDLFTSRFASFEIVFSLMKSSSSVFVSFKFLCEGDLFSLLPFLFEFFLYYCLRFLFYLSLLSNESSRFDFSVKRGDYSVVIVANYSAVVYDIVGYSIFAFTVTESINPFSLSNSDDC